MNSLSDRTKKGLGTHALKGGLLYIASRLHLLVLSVLLAGYLEYLQRGSASRMLAWLKLHPKPFALNAILMFALLLLFAAIIGRTWIAYSLLAVLLTIAGFISGIKMKVLGLPLLPWDVVLSKETQDMTPYVSGIVNWKLITAVAAFVAISFALLRFVPTFRSRFHWVEKIAFAAAAVVIGYCVANDKPAGLWDKFVIHDISWDQAANYSENGFLVTTSMNVDGVFIPAPKDYSAARIKQIVDGVQRRANVAPNVKPNIIVVLSEAFFDPTQLPNVAFDRDPVPTIRELQKSYTNGSMLSPQFGGGTANVELEVLTGNSMRFLPPGSTPYIQYISRPIDSLASILSRQGYKSTAMNPFHSWFFNSKNVNRYFGFDSFVSLEFFEQKMKGYYTEDAELAKTIIATTDKTEEPDFIFASSMENHFPYGVGKFDKNAFTVTGDVPDETKGILATYATGASDADLMLKTLIDHYKNSSEPTIVCFFGDHKPVLGDEYQAYRDTGFLKKDDPAEVEKLYSVPVVVWNNYLPPHQDKLDISPSYLGPYLLNLAQRGGTAYMDYLYALSQKHPVVPPLNLYGKYGVTADDFTSYRLLQYDSMFGKQYHLGDLKDKIVQPDFALGYGPLKIESVSPLQITAGVPFGREGDDAQLIVSGGPFVPHGSVYVNGKAVQTALQPDGTLRATVPKSVYAKPGKLTVEVKVTDSQNLVVSGSNKVQIEVKGK